MIAACQHAGVLPIPGLVFLAPLLLLLLLFYFVLSLKGLFSLFLAVLDIKVFILPMWKVALYSLRLFWLPSYWGNCYGNHQESRSGRGTSGRKQSGRCPPVQGKPLISSCLFKFLSVFQS